MSESTISSISWATSNLELLPTPTSTSIVLCWVPLTRNGKSVLSDSERLRAIEMLSDIQWDRYERREGTASDTYLTGRYFLLTLLGHFTGQTAEHVKLSYNRLNKPYLQPNPQGIEFNFTDTSSINDGVEQSDGLFAFSLNSAVGVDIEMPNRSANVKLIASKRFTEVEQAFVEHAKSDNIDHRFLQVWTRKEAFGKACGVGINFKMNQLNVLNPDSPTYRFNSREQDWCLQQVLGPNGEIACVVHAGTAEKKLHAFKIQANL